MAGARYLRYILLAFFVTLIIFFISSSSTPKSINDAHHLISDRIESMRGKLPAPNVLDHQQQSLPHNEVQHDTPPPPPPPPAAHPPSPPQPPTVHHPNSPPTTPHEPAGLAPATVPGERMNATFVTLARNTDVWEIAQSIRQVEDRFNHKFNYDWVFLNDKEFDDQFKRVTTNLVSGTAHYGLIPEEHWSYPEWIDQEKAARVRTEMHEAQVIYGDSESYRHMCRYESGFFFRHPLMNNYKWYWRVEPSIQLLCDINYDTFKWMSDNKKKYSFVISLLEYAATIPTLWSSTKNFMQQYPQHIAPSNSMDFLSDDGGETYNRCHFWSNFEIGDLDWLRSPAYLDYFGKLDHDGGFFYERWGDAPVHSIAAGLLLNKEEIHFFEDIAYYHSPFFHCPNDEQDRIDKKCHCDPTKNFDWNGYSCTNKYYKANGMQLPKGYAPT